MIDGIRAEVDYRQEQVRRDVAGSRRTGRATRGGAARTTADRPLPARPRVLRPQPQSGRPVC